MGKVAVIVDRDSAEVNEGTNHWPKMLVDPSRGSTLADGDSAQALLTKVNYLDFKVKGNMVCTGLI